MKANIDAEGKLKITPETESEAYMLKKWWEDWQHSRVVLQVAWKDPIPEEVQFEFVKPIK